MQGPPKRQVDAEEMLAELKRALETSTLAPHVQPPFRSTASKSGSRALESRRSQPQLQGSTRPVWRNWKLTAAGLALAGAVGIGGGFVFMNKGGAPKSELSVAPAEGAARLQDEIAPRSGGARAPTRKSPDPELLQAGNSAPRNVAGAAPATNTPLPAHEATDLDAPNLASFGLESPPPVFAPALLGQPATLAPAERIGPDGAPITAARSAPASAGPAPRAEAPKPRATPAPAPPAKPEAAKVIAAPSAPASTGSAPQAETPKPNAGPTPSPPAKPDAAKVAATPAPDSNGSAPQAETPKPNPALAPAPPAKPDAAKVAATPAPDSNGSAPRAETPKPKAAPTEHASNEPERPSTPKIHSRRKPPEKTSPQRLARSAKAAGKPVAEAERRSTEPPARPKEADQALKPAQGAGNPAPVAPVAAPSVPQRLADGVTHAFGYLVHLPGALVSHPADSNAAAH